MDPIAQLMKQDNWLVAIEPSRALYLCGPIFSDGRGQTVEPTFGLAQLNRKGEAITRDWSCEELWRFLSENCTSTFRILDEKDPATEACVPDLDAPDDLVDMESYPERLGYGALVDSGRCFVALEKRARFDLANQIEGGPKCEPEAFCEALIRFMVMYGDSSFRIVMSNDPIATEFQSVSSSTLMQPRPVQQRPSDGSWPFSWPFPEKP